MYRLTELNRYWTYTHLNPGKSELPLFGIRTGFIQPSKAGIDWIFLLWITIVQDITTLPSPVQYFIAPYPYRYKVRLSRHLI